MSFVVAPEAYDRFMGRYSIPLAPVFADFAGVAAGERILDVGVRDSMGGTRPESLTDTSVLAT